MKRYILIFASLFLALSCQQDIVYEADYVVTLDKSNTYIAGTPVRFNFSGNVDNILFYSGDFRQGSVKRKRAGFEDTGNKMREV